MHWHPLYSAGAERSTRLQNYANLTRKRKDRKRNSVTFQHLSFLRRLGKSGGRFEWVAGSKFRRLQLRFRLSRHESHCQLIWYSNGGFRRATAYARTHCRRERIKSLFSFLALPRFFLLVLHLVGFVRFLFVSQAREKKGFSRSLVRVLLWKWRR